MHLGQPDRAVGHWPCSCGVRLSAVAHERTLLPLPAFLRARVASRPGRGPSAFRLCRLTYPGAAHAQNRDYSAPAWRCAVVTFYQCRTEAALAGRMARDPGSRKGCVGETTDFSYKSRAPSLAPTILWRPAQPGATADAGGRGRPPTRGGRTAVSTDSGRRVLSKYTYCRSDKRPRRRPAPRRALVDDPGGRPHHRDLATANHEEP